MKHSLLFISNENFVSEKLPLRAILEKVFLKSWQNSWKISVNEFITKYEEPLQIFY